jgi:hypothetical protein
MTTGEELYLALVIVAFLAFIGTLFAAMVTAGGGTNTEGAEHHHYGSSPHH